MSASQISGGRSASASDLEPLSGYQFGDCLGKGAFGQVYRALNMATGETVAIKTIQLSNIPKAELGEIMSEINLLQNLKHPNIVKYISFDKKKEHLYIILEFCENGSLQNICKRFGKFPEGLVAVYISQVLEGLVYLHDQGVIHRDIKGANILTTKDGSVKLADFGVASTTGATKDDAVVGSPYWMAPEVIEQSGATTASDIWSVGCVVIELLEGKPPYHFLDPMPAMFRIVQDDSPPIPEGASSVVKDFLYHCFQKDPNLRVSAKKLLRHPWMVSARKQIGKNVPGAAEESKNETKVHANYHNNAILAVQEWNEALRSPSRPTKTSQARSRASSSVGRPVSPSPRPGESAMAVSISLGQHAPANVRKLAGNTALKAVANTPLGLVDKIREPPLLQPPEQEDDNWDDDFEDGISFTKLQALEKTTMDDGKSSERMEEKADMDDPSRTIRPHRSPSSDGQRSIARSQGSEIAPIMEDYSDLGAEEDEARLEEKFADFKMKNSVRRGLFHPTDIKIVGIRPPSPGPRTAPLPSSASNSMRRAVTPTPSQPHSRTSSFVGSLGRSDSDARRMLNRGEFDKYAEDDDEDYEDDYEDVFGKTSTGAGSDKPMQTLQLNTRLSDKSWLGDDDNDEDPFAEIEEEFVEEDYETNLQRDKHARLADTVNQLIDELTPAAPDFQLREACDQLLNILIESPEMQSQLVSAHGMLAILEVLEANEGRRSREVTLKLLQIINMLVTADIGFLESFCLVGGIPVLMGFTSKKYWTDCRAEASNFIQLLCHTSVLTLQMFISCRGLRVLVQLLHENIIEQADLVAHALNGIKSVFDLQSATSKNDFCRMFVREGLLDPLTSALQNVMSTAEENAAAMKAKVIHIILVLCQVSQSDIHVRNALGDRQVILRLLRSCNQLEPEYLVQVLKAIKHLSMNATLLDVLQNVNAIEILIRVAEDQVSGPHSTEISNHIFQTLYNLCRLNKSRQEEAAQTGIIPCLQRIIEISSPLKQFALPILCDLASASKSCRVLLWRYNTFSQYLGLLADPYFQVSALEAVYSWLQDETARVEDELTKPASLDLLVRCFVTAKANSFENLLDPLLKICRLSTPVTTGLARSQFFTRIFDRLGHSKPVVRLNLLRILRVVCDVHPNRTGLVERYGIYDVVTKLSKEDGALMVSELAREMLPALTPVLMPAANKTGRGAGTPKTAVALKKRRAASETSIFGAPPATTAKRNTLDIVETPRASIRQRAKLGDIPWESNNH